MRLLIRLLGFLFAAGVVLFLVGVAGVAGLIWYFNRDLPDSSQLQNYEPPAMTRVHAADGSLLGEYAKERRLFLPIQAVPKLVINAFLAAEDKNFYERGEHRVRATIDYIRNLGSNRRPQGASTISLQVAKNFLLTNEVSHDRRIYEGLLATRIERTLSKDRILELYLNEIYLGLGTYGIAAASERYFDKPVNELTVAEAAYLAALPKMPERLHPIKNHDRAIERRNHVIDRLQESGWISQADADKARNEPLVAASRASRAHTFAGEYFADEVRRDIVARYGEKKLFEGGLSVRTTLDPQIQVRARKTLVTGLVNFDEQQGYRGAISKLDLSGDWGVKLAGIKSLSDISPWRLAVVLETSDQSARIGFQPERGFGGAISKQRETGLVTLDGVKWAKAASMPTKGETPTAVSQVLQPGDVIYADPICKDGHPVEGQYRLRQQGYRGAVSKLDLSGDWGAKLAGMLSDVSPWRMAVVLETSDQSARIGLQPRRELGGAVSKQRETGLVTLDGVKWAKAASEPTKGEMPTAVSQVLQPGDVIYADPLHKDGRRVEGQYRLRQLPEVSGAMVVMDPWTGRVLAMVGGFSFDQNRFNRATQAYRQPGSSSKPVVHSVALDHGYRLSTVAVNTPIEIEDGRFWWPKAFESCKHSFGKPSLREALRLSLGTVKAQEISMQQVGEYACRFLGAYDELPNHLSFVLGEGETTVMRMVTAYSMFANGGRRVKPTLIDRIQDRYGHTIFRYDQRECRSCDAPKPQLIDPREQVLNSMTGYQITKLLESIVQAGGGPIAGKAGTTNEAKDAWFVGYSSNMAVAIYMGYDKPRPLGHLAAPIAPDFLNLALADKPAVPFERPAGVKLIPVASKTGMGAYSGETDGTILEAFKPGTAPPDNCLCGWNAWRQVRWPFCP